jgi:hypothetical protein
MLLAFQLEAFAQRSGILPIDCTQGVFLQTVERPRSSNAYANTLHFLDLGFDTLVIGRVAEPRQDIKEKVAAWWVVAHGRVVAQQICCPDIIDIRIARIHQMQCPAEPFDILWRGTDQQIQVFGRADQSVKTHGRCTDEDILEILLLECAQYFQEFVMIHGRIVSC